MSKLEEAVPVKLFTGVIYSKNAQVDNCIKRLEKRFGKTDYVSERFSFHYTTYYEDEMGTELSRIIITFKPLIKRDELVKIKHFTNEVEELYSSNDKRQINIDPGYIAPEHLILATGKGYYHRPYLGKGVYSDLTLVYTNKDFRPLRWTYPDYRTKKMRRLFKNLREKYMLELAEVEFA